MADDLPLALRRSRRASLVQPQDRRHQQSPDNRRPTSSHAAAGLATPSRGQKKRVRFSDPGRATDEASTGLTPSLRRTTLLSTTPGSGGKRRRQLSSSDTLDNNRGGDGEEVQVTFLPLRQVIDGRVKRRIRRNGLSEEMNLITAEKRRKAQQTKAEMDALRAEVAAKDAQIRRLSGATAVADYDGDIETEIERGRKADPQQHYQMESIDDLKRQVEELRNALKSPAPSHANSEDTHVVGWATSTQDPFALGSRDGGGEYYYDSDMEIDFDNSDDEDGFGDSTMAELACSTPSRRPASMRHSFPTPPSTGSPPPRLGTPCSEEQQQQHRSPSMSDASMQVQLSDEEKRELEEELASLHLEIAKLTSTLETYEAVTSRLSEKLSPFGPQSSSAAGSAAEAILASRSPAVRVEVQLNNLLKTFASRSAALEEIDTSLHELGFAGSTPIEVLASLSSSLRSVRLELEYLTPGEIALPLTAAGAAVLDLLLSRLRELSRQGLEDQDVIAEYQHLERSLRRQLVARVEAMDDMRAEISTLKDKVRLRNLRIRELEAGVDRLQASVRTYTRDMRDLEALAQRLEADLDAAHKDASSSRQREQERDEAEAALEEKLAGALARASAVKAHMEELLAARQREHEVARAADGAERDALRAQVEGVNEALRAARSTIRTLETERGVLRERVGVEKSRARAAVEAMKAELEKAVRMGEDLLLASPKSPERDDY